METDLDLAIATIAGGIARLRSSPRATDLFGAASHGFTFGSPVSSDDLRTFERRSGCTLPADYRAFLQRLGNGGVGPFHGVLALEGRPRGMHRSHIGDLARPFAHSAAWSSAEDDDDHDIVPVDGAIPIVDEGDQTTDWLVVSGPEAGHVWREAEGFRPWASTTERMPAGVVKWSPKMIGAAASYANAPDETPRARLRFLEWYSIWLRRALAAV